MPKRKKQEEMIILDSDRENRRIWWKNKYLWMSICFSIAWMVFIIQYLLSSGWWQNRFELAPPELIGGLGGLTLPMVVFWLVCAYCDRTDQMESEAQTLKAYLNELVYPTEEGAIYTRTLTDALRTQIKEFRSVFQEVNEETLEVRDDLKRWVRDLSAIIKHANTKTIASIREIARHIQGMASATEMANQQSAKTSALFSEQAAILERVVEGTIRSTHALTQTLGNNIVEIQKLTKEISAINAQTAQSVAKSEQVMSSLNQNSEKIEESINLYETSARQQNARLFGNLEKVLSVFRAHGDLLEQEVDRTANKLLSVEGALKTQAASVFNLADKATKRADDVVVSLGTTQEELNNALKAFKSESDAVIQCIEKAGNKVNRTPLVQQIKTDDLLEEASSILTRLQEYSVDMATLFSPKNEESLWEQYYNGDKTVFMRHIKTELSAGKYKKLKDLYKTDAQFKTSVNQYMAAFENMTQVLDKGDENKLLMSIVIGSDVGRLYMVLANLLKGKNNAH